MLLRKNGQLRYIERSRARPPGRASSLASAAPTPYQLESRIRFWFQAKVQGIARRSSMRCPSARRAGREPIASSEISSIGVTARKKAGKAGVPYTSMW